MKVFYQSKKIQKKVEPASNCIKNYGKDMAKIIHRRLMELLAAPSLETMRGIGDCHELSGNRKGSLGIDLQGPYRLILKPCGQNEYVFNNQLIWAKVLSVKIISIENYH